MDAKDTLKRVMTALGMEPKEEVQETNFEQRKIMDGEVSFEAEAFEAGQACFVMTEDGERLPAPEGEYTLEDGMVMKVDAQGVIEDIYEQQVEEEKPEPVVEETPEEVAVEAEAETPTPAPAKKIVESQIVETHFADQVEALKVDLAKQAEEFATERSLWDAEKVALSEQIDALKKQLAEEPATKPMTHSVEGKEKQIQFKQQGSLINTTQSRVMNRLFNK